MIVRCLRRAVTAAVLTLALAVPLATPVSATGNAPGAPGIGDPYFPDYGNGGYDARHYSLRLNYQPGTDRLDGKASIVAVATQRLNRFNLDFLLDVKEIRVNGRPAAFAKSGAHELEVTPAMPLLKGTPFTVQVTYGGNPGSIQVPGIVTPWIKRADGALALGEPEIAWWWYPSNDHPADKATFDISVTVPDGTEAVSNGILAGQRSSQGRTTYHWVMDKPMATYLATLYVGDLEVRKGRSPSGLPVYTAYGKDLGPREQAAKDSVERTPEIVGWLASVFGRYPFSSMGGSVINENVGFALETQAQPVYDSVFFEAGPDVGVVVHENAHQWFGDSVALKRWSDIWLNEGFATYAELLWSEKEGTGTAAELANAWYDQIPPASAFWQVKVSDPGPANLFNGAIYLRGAMALQALRSEVGDRDFFTILRTWARINRQGNATIPEFVSLAEKISGEQLDTVFSTWLDTVGKPAAKPAPTAAAAATAAPPAAFAANRRMHEIMHGPIR
ncbi:M1 family metallopeptidase [Nonomuraea typhae]|uniref:M1 family metallopeptidase n=1 Tax=Nonomuraea typhae TaxID=2603600 RepID=UPI0012FC54F1|nr:M1 family metallopeptidase [Nonomuraea typhae]